MAALSLQGVAPFQRMSEGRNALTQDDDREIAALSPSVSLNSSCVLVAKGATPLTAITDTRS